MKDDLHLTFGEIFNNDPRAFLDQLIDIQTHTANRRKAEKWADQLRLIDISEVPRLENRVGANTLSYTGGSQFKYPERRRERLVLPLLEKTDDDGEVPYIAVSWRWTTGKQPPQWGCDARESYDYRIQRPGRVPHKSQFPDHYFDRVIMYAQSWSIDRLWIDKESVYQEDDEDRNLGVQIMDAVYEGSDLSVGLLTTPLMHQNEIDLLDELLSGLIFRNPHDDTGTPKYWASMKEKKLLRVQTLILRILSDPRWSRGWIFQEDHLSSDRMRLMIPHSEGLKIDDGPWDNIPGNLIIDLLVFRKAVTRFCMASSENQHRWPISEMLGKAKQYNMFNQRSYNVCQHPRDSRCIRIWTDGDMSGTKMNHSDNYVSGTTYPSTTLSILDDICHRDLEIKEDMIAIMANACKFSRRLDISKSSRLVISETYSLSAILLTLILINGEIMETDRVRSHRTLMDYTLRQYMEEVQYQFNAPTLKREQSFIDHCRLKESTINQRGVEVPGFLFKLLPSRKPSSSDSEPHPLKLTADDRQHIERLKQQNRQAQKFHPGRKFNLLAEEVISILLQKLRRNYGSDCALAEFIEQTLACDTNPPPPEDALPSTPYVLDNMIGVVQALIDGRELRLARLDSEPNTAEPSAIFIAPYRSNEWYNETWWAEYGTGTNRVWVFTSWDNGWRNHGMERLASMEVAPFTQGSGPTDRARGLRQWDPDGAESAFLRRYGWVNGVWNIEGKHMSRYTFPIAGLTSPQIPQNGGRTKTSPPPQMPVDGECSGAASPPATIRRSKRKRHSSNAELSG
jgi:hypothetical protein